MSWETLKTFSALMKSLFITKLDFPLKLSPYSQLLSCFSFHQLIWVLIFLNQWIHVILGHFFRYRQHRNEKFWIRSLSPYPSTTKRFACMWTEMSLLASSPSVRHGNTITRSHLCVKIINLRRQQHRRHVRSLLTSRGGKKIKSKRIMKSKNIAMELSLR